MNLTNVEIKASCNDPQRIRELLVSKNARYAGRDHQIDTYYQAKNGRLKLRRGNIETALIAYDREDVSTPKRSDVLLYQTQDASALHSVLTRACGIIAVVDKTRDIYFIDNVKFHVDEVKDLGTFVEIEAIDSDSSVSQKQLHDQVIRYLEILGIRTEELLTHSYSDMLSSCA